MGQRRYGDRQGQEDLRGDELDATAINARTSDAREKQKEQCRQQSN